MGLTTFDAPNLYDVHQCMQVTPTSQISYNLVLVSATNTENLCGNFDFFISILFGFLCFRHLLLYGKERHCAPLSIEMTTMSSEHIIQ